MWFDREVSIHLKEILSVEYNQCMLKIYIKHNEYFLITYKDEKKVREVFMNVVDSLLEYYPDKLKLEVEGEHVHRND